MLMEVALLEAGGGKVPVVITTSEISYKDFVSRPTSLKTPPPPLLSLSRSLALSLSRSLSLALPRSLSLSLSLSGQNRLTLFSF